MSALDAARHHAAETEETSGAIRDSHLTAVQAYATLALAEALTAVADGRQVTVNALDDETLYESATELVADLLRMDDEEAISLAKWPAAKALVTLIRPWALVDLNAPVPLVPADEHDAHSCRCPSCRLADLSEDGAS